MKYDRQNVHNLYLIKIVQLFIAVATGCILPIAHRVHLEFKFRYIKMLILFSMKVKELFEPLVLRRKADGSLLFWKAFSWETDLWVTLGEHNWGGKYVFNWKSIEWKQNGVLQKSQWCLSHIMCKRISRYILLLSSYQNMKFPRNPLRVRFLKLLEISLWQLIMLQGIIKLSSDMAQVITYQGHLSC